MLVQCGLCRVSGCIHDQPLLYQFMLRSDLSIELQWRKRTNWVLMQHWILWLCVIVDSQPLLQRLLLGQLMQLPWWHCCRRWSLHVRWSYDLRWLHHWLSPEWHFLCGKYVLLLWGYCCHRCSLHLQWRHDLRWLHYWLSP